MKVECWLEPQSGPGAAGGYDALECDPKGKLIVRDPGIHFLRSPTGLQRI